MKTPRLPRCFRSVADLLKRRGGWHWSASCNSPNGCPTAKPRMPCVEESIGSTRSAYQSTIRVLTPACCASSALACWRARRSSICSTPCSRSAVRGAGCMPAGASGPTRRTSWLPSAPTIAWRPSVRPFDTRSTCSRSKCPSGCSSMCSRTGPSGTAAGGTTPASQVNKRSATRLSPRWGRTAWRCCKPRLQTMRHSACAPSRQSNCCARSGSRTTCPPMTGYAGGRTTMACRRPAGSSAPRMTPRLTWLSSAPRPGSATKVHLTETCEPETPNLITDVQTVVAPLADWDSLPVIHQGLAERDLLPSQHLVDSGYVDAALLVASRRDFGIDLVGPPRGDQHWQAREQTGFSAEHFHIDWEQQRATCPEGRTSVSWSPAVDNQRTEVIKIRFSEKDCSRCPSVTRCVRSSKKYPRRLITVRRQAAYEALRAARQREKTRAFAELYAIRSGMEGTISQGVRRCGMRRTRYRGLAKTHLDHVLTATALNCLRLSDWLAGAPKATTQHSRFARLLAFGS